MTTFKIYNVVDKTTGKIVKIGSTVQTLARRKRQIPYNSPSYANYELISHREFECDDQDFGILLLRVREQFEISRANLWIDQNGLNAAEPVRAFLFGMEGSIQGKIGGKIRGKQCAENGHCARISSLGVAAAQKSKKAHEAWKKQGEILGKKNKESGHMTALGKEWGKKTGIENCKKWINSPKNLEHIKNLSTPKSRLKGAIAAGKIAKESGQASTLGKRSRDQKLGIFSPNYNRSEASKTIQEKLTPAQRSKHARYMNTFKTIEQQRKAGYIGAHKRFHIPKNIINPKCFLCCPEKLNN